MSDFTKTPVNYVISGHLIVWHGLLTVDYSLSLF